MKKRLLALGLWFYAGWYLGAVIAAMLGISEILGPILGIAAAAVVVGDPKHLIWPGLEAPGGDRGPTAAR